MFILYIWSWEVLRSCDCFIEVMYLKKRRRYFYYKLFLFVIYLVMKYVVFLVIMVLRIMEVKLDFWLGVKVFNLLSKIFMELKLENLYRVYVVIIFDFVYGKNKIDKNMFYYIVKFDYIEFLWIIGFILIY